MCMYASHFRKDTNNIIAIQFLYFSGPSTCTSSSQCLCTCHSLNRWELFEFASKTYSQPLTIMEQYAHGRKHLRDVTNTVNETEFGKKRFFEENAKAFLPQIDENVRTELSNSDDLPNVDLCFQNVHPMLTRYQHDLSTDTMSYDQLRALLADDKEEELLLYLQETGTIASQQQCEFCGAKMRMSKQIRTWYWICTRRVNGVKCNKGKFSVRQGTLFDNSKFSIQTIMLILWNFLHRLSEQQCKDFTNIGNKNNQVVVDYYGDFRRICNDWVRNPINKPKLGGFGKVVEMDESYFPGKPKYNRGRRLGTTWTESQKWAFALVERGSLDCVIEQVDSGRSRQTLLPIINANCMDGTVFCSDSRKAYNKLADNLNLEDTIYFPVNHSQNYVDPQTGAHTQTVEGLWRHLKNFLPGFGLRPSALESYIGWFMWYRYCKQRKLNMLDHFLKCAGEIRPPTLKVLPVATLTSL